MLTSKFKNNNFMNFRYKNDKNAEINSKWVYNATFVICDSNSFAILLPDYNTTAVLEKYSL